MLVLAEMNSMEKPPGPSKVKRPAEQPALEIGLIISIFGFGSFRVFFDRTSSASSPLQNAARGDGTGRFWRKERERKSNGASAFHLRYHASIPPHFPRWKEKCNHRCVAHSAA